MVQGLPGPAESASLLTYVAIGRLHHVSLFVGLFSGASGSPLNKQPKGGRAHSGSLNLL